MNKLIMPLLCSNILISTLSPALAQAEDWIGLEDEPVTQLGYSYSFGEDNSDSHQFSLYHEFDASTDLNLQYNRNNTATDTQDFDYKDVIGQLSWQAAENTRLGISYQYQGKNQELEITNMGILASYTLFPFAFTAEYREGNLSLFTQNNNNNPLIPEKIDSDMLSQHYTLNWFYQDFGFYVNYQSFHYQKNLSALENQPLLQALVKPGALANTGLLLDSSTSAGVTSYQEQRELSWLLSSTRYATDNSHITSLQFDWRQIMPDLNIIYSAGVTDESQDNLSFGIGFEWNV
jgi:hypothetical protein